MFYEGYPIDALIARCALCSFAAFDQSAHLSLFYFETFQYLFKVVRLLF